MLKKSLQSTFIMSGLAFLSILFTLVFCELLRNPTRKIYSSEFQPGAACNDTVSILLVIVIMLLVIVLPGALCIRNLSEVHFGVERFVRWIIFGFIFSRLAQLRNLIPDGTADQGFSSLLAEKGISTGPGLSFLYMSHYLAFGLLTRKSG